MYKIFCRFAPLIFGLFVTFIITGCNNKSIEPPFQVVDKNNTKSLNIYEQELIVPSHLIPHLFPAVTIKPQYVTKNKLHGKWRKLYNGNKEFIFENKYAPYYILKLKEPLKINSLTIYNTVSYIPISSKSNKTNLIGQMIGSIPGTTNHPSLVHIGTKETKELIPYKTAFVKNDKKLDVKKENIFLKKKPYTDEIHIRISRLEPSSFFVGHSKYSSIKNNYDFSIKGYNPKYENKLINWTLKNRNSIDENENLVRNIAQDDKEKFKYIKENHELFKLPKYSITKLPKDIDMRYAITNTSQVFRTGRYKDIAGKYKIFKVLDIDFNTNKTNFKETKRVKINGKQIENKFLTNSNPNKKTSDEFIDFSKGI